MAGPLTTSARRVLRTFGAPFVYLLLAVLGHLPAVTDRLTAAAAESDLRERAETNTRAMLTGLARSLGVDDVEVRFAETADSAG